MLRTAQAQSAPSTAPAAASPSQLAPAANGTSSGAGESLEARLKALVQQQPVMLFMKGSPSEPRCGFSRKVGALQGKAARLGAKDLRRLLCMRCSPSKQWCESSSEIVHLVAQHKAPPRL